MAAESSLPNDGGGGGGQNELAAKTPHRAKHDKCMNGARNGPRNSTKEGFGEGCGERLPLSCGWA